MLLTAAGTHSGETIKLVKVKVPWVLFSDQSLEVGYLQNLILQKDGLHSCIFYDWYHKQQNLYREKMKKEKGKRCSVHIRLQHGFSRMLTQSGSSPLESKTLNCLCIKFATTTAQCPSLTLVKNNCKSKKQKITSEKQSMLRHNKVTNMKQTCSRS